MRPLLFAENLRICIWSNPIIYLDALITFLWDDKFYFPVFRFLPTSVYSRFTGRQFLPSHLSFSTHKCAFPLHGKTIFIFPPFTFYPQVYISALWEENVRKSSITETNTPLLLRHKISKRKTISSKYAA